METIRHRNSLDTGFYFFILIAFGAYTFLPLYSESLTLFIVAGICLCFMFLFLHFRVVNITIDKNSINIDFTFLTIPYKKIHKNFDVALVSKHDIGSVSFNKDNKEILRFDYYDDPGEPTVETGTLEIIDRNKKFEVGNIKTSYKLFNKIREVTLRQVTSADT